MKSWVILALPWLVMSLTWTWTLADMETEETWTSEEIVSGTDGLGQLIDTTFAKDCKSNGWVLTNATIQWNNGTKHIVCNITYNEPGYPTIYTIHIVINECNENNTSCSGKPTVWVDEVNCNSKNIPKNDVGICNATKAVGNLEEKEWLEERYGRTLGDDIYSLLICIDQSLN